MRLFFAEDTQSQRIVITRWREDIRLFLNGQLQFSTIDEYRYHESLVHPAMRSVDRVEDVLILGGGDGMAVREVLTYPSVKRVLLVDLDPRMTTLFRDHHMLRTLNDQSLSDPRVSIVHEDAFRFMNTTRDMFDVVLLDLPDPSEIALGKLYARAMYALVERRLRPGGAFATHATSPFRARTAFWCIAETAREATRASGRHITPYHVPIPSFGQWGFVLASARPPKTLDDPAFRFISTEVFAGATTFPRDLQKPDNIPITTLSDPAVVRLYRDGYSAYFN